MRNLAIKILPILLFANSITKLNFLGKLYYPAIFFYCLYVILHSKIVVNKLTLFLIFSIVVSWMVNEIPSFYRSGERLISFILVIISFGPMLSSRTLTVFRKELLNRLLKWSTIITVLSFLLFLVGILPLIGKGGFQGLTVQAMTMSPLAGISFIYLFSGGSFLRKKNLNYIVMIICVLVSFMAASRAGLLALAISSVYILFKRRLVKPSVVIFTVLFIALFFYSVPERYYSHLENKFAKSEKQEDQFSSRSNLWVSRILEFKSSPYVGVGFQNAIEEFNTYGINKKSGVIESGSSWLTVISMTGLLGSVLFFMLISSTFWKSSSYVHQALLIFFVFHMFFEGYVFSSGNILMLLFWLTLSINLHSFKDIEYD